MRTDPEGAPRATLHRETSIAVRTHARLVRGAARSDALRLARSVWGAVPPAGALFFESPAALGHDLRVLVRPSFRFTVRGGEGCVGALLPAGESALDAIAEALEGRRDGRRVFFAVPRPARTVAAAATDTERGAAPSVFDLLRRFRALFRDESERSCLQLGGSLGFELLEHFEDLTPLGKERGADDDPDVDLAAGFDVIERRADGPGVLVRTGSLGAADPAERADALAESVLALGEEVSSGSAESEGDDAAPRVLASRPSASDYREGVRRLREAVLAGEIFQAVLARRLVVASSRAPLSVFRRLRDQENAPYHFFFAGEGAEILGASPETHLRVQGDRATLAPIAGTRRRDADPARDAALVRELREDPKERAEHAMLLDLARNDLARIARRGDRRTREAFRLLTLPRVHHLVSEVEARMAPGQDAFDALRTTLGMGTLTGAPKRRALELLRAIEGERRGFFGGAIAWITPGGDLDSAICIRTLRHRAGRYLACAGAGIVAASDPQRELDETTLKLSGPLAALGVTAAVIEENGQ